MSEFGKFITHDWWIAIPMFIMSFGGIGLLIWRLLLNLNGNTNLNSFLPKFQDRLEKEGVPGALRLCKARPDVIPRRLFVAGLETAKQGLAAQRRAMANIIELEIMPDLNFLLPTILAIAKVATMVGLFGTVISMIGTFTEIPRPSARRRLRRAGRRHRPGPLRHGPRADHRHPAGLRARAAQGLGGPVRGAHEERRPEADGPDAGHRPKRQGSAAGKTGTSAAVKPAGDGAAARR